MLQVALIWLSWTCHPALLTGPVTTFVMEPFVPHEEEFYLSISSNRTGREVSFSTAGGMDVEEHWDQ